MLRHCRWRKILRRRATRDDCRTFWRQASKKLFRWAVAEPRAAHCRSVAVHYYPALSYPVDRQARFNSYSHGSRWKQLCGKRLMRTDRFAPSHTPVCKAVNKNDRIPCLHVQLNGSSHTIHRQTHLISSVCSCLLRMRSLRLVGARHEAPAPTQDHRCERAVD